MSLPHPTALTSIHASLPHFLQSPGLASPVGSSSSQPNIAVSNAPCSTLFVANLGQFVSEYELKEIFSRSGRTMSAELRREKGLICKKKKKIRKNRTLHLPSAFCAQRKQKIATLSPPSIMHTHTHTPYTTSAIIENSSFRPPMVQETIYTIPPLILPHEVALKKPYVCLVSIIHFLSASI